MQAAEARCAELNPRLAELARAAEDAPAVPGFAQALRSPVVGIIAELKRSSPSKGSINPALDVEATVVAYESGGAVAVSVLTETARFGGSNDDLIVARRTTRVPLLKKDFHVQPVQLLEAKALGASAALVIARAVDPARLAELLDTGRNIGLEILVEVRDKSELRLALDLGAELIGVNNRDLETLEVDFDTSLGLIPQIPHAVTAIGESGITARAQVDRLAAAGANGALVGTELSRSADPAAVLRALTGARRNQRARQD